MTVAEAEAQMQQLIDLVGDGEEVVICQGQDPVAKLVGYVPDRKRRRPGDMRGRIWMSDDFDEPDEEIERLFGMRD